MAQMRRFLVRKGTSEVFVWTEELAKRDDLQEVFAEDAAQALTKEAMPDPRSITLDQLEGMSKGDLLIFARVKLGMEIPASTVMEEIQTQVKEKLFTAAAVTADATDAASITALNGRLAAALVEGSQQAAKVATLTAELAEMTAARDAAQAEAATATAAANKATEELAAANVELLKLQPKP